MSDLTHLSPDDAAAAFRQMGKKGHKYHAQKTEYKGEMYDSKAEAEYARLLDLRIATGEIWAWHRGVPMVLQEQPRITYRPDFMVTPYGMHRSVWFVDVKGVETAAWKIKAKLFVAEYPSTPLIVVKKGREYVFGEKSRTSASAGVARSEPSEVRRSTRRPKAGMPNAQEFPQTGRGPNG